MRRVALAVVCVIVLAACSTDDNESLEVSTNGCIATLSINANIAESVTRVDSLDATTFEAGDTIGLYILNSNGDAYGDAEDSYNVPAVFDGSNWTLLTDVYLSDTTAYITAYYPYNEEIGNALPTSSNSTMDISGGDSDPLFSSENTANSENNEVTLTFEHALSRLTFSVKTANDSNTVVLSAITLTDTTSYTSSYYTFRTEPYIYVDKDSIGLMNGGTGEKTLTRTLDTSVTLSTERTDVDITVYETNAQNISATFTLNGDDYTVDLPAIKYRYFPGERYTFLVTVTVVEASSSSDSDDTDGSTDSDSTTPTIILTVDTTSVINPWTDGGTDEEWNIEVEAPNYEAVDLGLSVKWATCNIGAESPEDYGNYYAWGETETKDDYSSSTSVTYGVDMDDIAGDAEYDAATANWGSSWRMPTYDEMKELRDSCTWTWTTENEVNGYLVTGSNGNSIFLPAAGYRGGTSLLSVGSRGGHWSSTPSSSDTHYAYSLGFNSSGRNVLYNGYYRYHGLSVRPVSD